MLKITEYRNVLGEDGKSIKREKIDLKELEKFGFKDERHSTISICKETREIRFNYDVKDAGGVYGIMGNIDELNVLYDLIRANLVEKVSDR